jgi:hypothetical protein
LNASTQNQPTNKNEKFANASQKLKEVQATAQIQRYCTTFNFAPTLPSPPTTPNSKKSSLKFFEVRIFV